jgi:hypothetical protein
MVELGLAPSLILSSDASLEKFGGVFEVVKILGGRRGISMH